MARKVGWWILAAVFFAAAWAGSASADTVYFKNGTSLWAEETDEDGDEVIVRRGGLEQRFPMKDVLRVEKLKSNLPPYSVGAPPAGPPPPLPAGAPAPGFGSNGQGMPAPLPAPPGTPPGLPAGPPGAIPGNPPGSGPMGGARIPIPIPTQR